VASRLRAGRRQKNLRTGPYVRVRPATYPTPRLRRSRIRCDDRDPFSVRIGGSPDRKGRVLSPKRSKKCLGCRSANAAYRRLRAGKIHAFIRARRHADRPRSARLRTAAWRCLPRSVKCMKTAVSIPDDVFEAAERLARRTKNSRSQFFSDRAEGVRGAARVRRCNRCHGSSMWRAGESER